VDAKDPRLDRPGERGCPSAGHFRAAIGHGGGGRLAAERTSSGRVGALSSRPSTRERPKEERKNVVDGAPSPSPWPYRAPEPGIDHRTLYTHAKEDGIGWAEGLLLLRPLRNGGEKKASDGSPRIPFLSRKETEGQYVFQ
jgi:hypothetical protein